MFRNYINKVLKKDVAIKNAEFILTFIDSNRVDNYAFSAVSWAVENKVITGKINNDKKYIDPLGTATRAETASIIYKYINNSEN